MQSRSRFLLIAAAIFLFIFNGATARIQSTYGDFDYSLSSIFKPESFFGNNTTWFNSDNRDDKAIFARHTFDMLFDVNYGMQTYGKKIGKFLFQMRNKYLWGKPESTASTTNAPIKLVESVIGTHSHSLPLLIWRIRQIFLQFTLNEALELPFKNVHLFTLGLFPFQVGRGIALGDAYAASGFLLWNDGAIDQYAPGLRFGGELLPVVLTYDIYGALLTNNSSSLSDTSKKILGQEYGRLKTPSRGFGKVNFIAAARLNWNVFDTEALGRLMIEPYAVYNHDPEQQVQFPSDATSKLGTLGFAGEYYGERFECGFDYAVNLGYQRVKGWDRNLIQTINNNGQIALVNDRVFTMVNGVNQKVPYVDRSPSQNIINNAFRDELQNGQVIGQVANAGYLSAPVGQELILTNASNRFRNPYKNIYGGWMFVADALYASKNKNLSIAGTVGVASGDDNPNLATKDGTYDGFTSLQEAYSGKRVRSAFLLSGKGKRLLSTPTSDQAPDPFAQSVSGFTNLVFTGVAINWKPAALHKRFEINPNVLAYWQEKPIGKARTFLGVEWSTFMNYNMLKDMKLFIVTSVFFPGSHYADRKGVSAETRQQLMESDNLDVTGFTQDRIDSLGNNIAYTFNLGFIYSF